jgi:hypothetical protein
MPRILPRPTKEELETLSSFLRVASLQGSSRWRAIAVETWASGKTMREAAVEANRLFRQMGEPERGEVTAVFRAINLYRKAGLQSFRLKPAARGKPKVAAEKEAAAVQLLKDAAARGEPLSYRAVAEIVGISKSKVGMLAKGNRLDGKNRRGRVAPPLPSPDSAGT